MIAAPRRRRRFPHDRRIQLLALGAGLPALVLAGVLLFRSDLAPRTQWTLGVLVVIAWLAFASSAREAVTRPLQTLSNLLGALREEDFSFRARVGRRDDPLGQALSEVNALAQTLREQRLGALEATALLRKVMEEIDVAVFAFDASLGPAADEPRGRAPPRRAFGAADRPRGRGRGPRGLPRGRGAAHRRGVLPRGLRPLRPASRHLPAARQAACSCWCSPT